jgi:hypothetical protein
LSLKPLELRSPQELKWFQLIKPTLPTNRTLSISSGVMYRFKQSCPGGITLQLKPTHRGGASTESAARSTIYPRRAQPVSSGWHYQECGPRGIAAALHVRIDKIRFCQILFERPPPYITLRNHWALQGSVLIEQALTPSEGIKEVHWLNLSPIIPAPYLSTDKCLISIDFQS